MLLRPRLCIRSARSRASISMPLVPWSPSRMDGHSRLTFCLERTGCMYVFAECIPQMTQSDCLLRFALSLRFAVLLLRGHLHRTKRESRASDGCFPLKIYKSTNVPRNLYRIQGSSLNGRVIPVASSHTHVLIAMCIICVLSFPLVRSNLTPRPMVRFS